MAGLSNAFRLYDQLLAMDAYLAAMADYASGYGLSRGSVLYYQKSGSLAQFKLAEIPEIFRFVPDDGSRASLVQEIYPDHGSYTISWRPVHPIPDRSGDVFENIWREYREHKNIID